MPVDAASALVVQACPQSTPAHWLEIELLDEDGNPVPNEEFRVTLPNGEVVRGFLDDTGHERLDPVDDPGACVVGFPNLDGPRWRFDGTAGPR